jgi:hypothetical protein
MPGTELAQWLFMSGANRRSAEPRRRVQYHVGGQAYPGDLVFDGMQPVLVVSWRTIDLKRVPYVSFLLDVTHLEPLPSRPREYLYKGDLLRTGKITSHPAPWNEPQA